MSIAVMQPYFFPYIGYFQLIHSVDHFVFYDDVNFITRGWINRNKILVNGQEKLITVPCIKASQNKLINEITFDRNNTDFKKLHKTIEQAYKKAPYFNEIFPLIEKVLNTGTTNIAALAQESIITTCKYLGLITAFKISSKYFAETKGMEKADRLIAICKKENAENYVNAAGGKEIYAKPYFLKQNIHLFFIENQIPQYPQFINNFVPALSIIDVLMFNSKEQIIGMLDKYKLE